MDRATPSEFGFERISNRRVFEEVCDQIRKQLAAGVLKPGDKLPAERDLAVEFGVSRPVIREAIRTLEISGILEQKKGVKGGAFIRSGSADMITHSLQNLIVVGRISVAGLFEARKIIQEAVTRLACERGSDEDFNAIEANLNEIAAYAEREDWAGRSEAAVSFFRLIAQATHNDTLVVMIDSLSDMIRSFVKEGSGPRYRPELIPIRWEILASLRRGDSESATKHMGQYLDTVHQAILKESQADLAPRRKSAPAKRASATHDAPIKKTATRTAAKKSVV